jgi:hypothetical protein
MKRYLGVFAFVVLFSTAAGAAKVQLFPGLGDATLNINVQLQMWVQAVETPQANYGTTWGPQVFMRRIRPIISGDVTKQIHYFLQFDSPSYGRYSAADPTGLTGRVLVQDAQIQYEPQPGVFVEGGILLLPLSHNQVQSTTSFVTLDLHSNTIRFPGATAPNQATTGLREPGIQTRGWALDKKLGWRLGVYNGVRGTPGAYDPANAGSLQGVNRDGLPQVGGYLHWNFLDTEERGWLYQGVYFNEKPILGVGAGFGFQPKAIRGIAPPGGAPPSAPQDWRAFAADIYAAIPPAPNQEVIAQFAYYNYDFGSNNGNTGNGFFAELGYRFDTIQPFVSVEYFQANDIANVQQTARNDARLWFAGVNWWYRRINSLKFEVSGSKTGSLTAPVQHIITVQWQLFF